VASRIEKNGARMTSPGVVIDNFEVTVYGSVPTDPIRARISLSAHSVERPDQVIDLQTSYTARTY